VQGLGLCDALRVRLEPCQIAGAIEQLEARQEPLRESFEHARTRWDELAERNGGPADPRAEEDLSRSEYALRVLAKLRGQLPTADHDAPVWIVGPGSTMTSFVAGAVINAAEDLAELVRQSPRTSSKAQIGLRKATAAAAAWVETYIECEALEWFNFDPEWDPVERMA
jgi:hypothetical protein